ncbi:MAG: winged helix-turn-helix transcriptional regulator [candidate division KSB1 bacterium]|nr:winged helix-turn-helix transcriptional regulator [candidate division KSB1 bacterium]
MFAQSTDPNELAPLLAEAAWQRLRSLALSFAKLENFVPLMPGAFVPPKSDADKSKSATAAEDSRTLAREFLLTNLSVVFSSEQTQVLLLMAAYPEDSPASLAEKIGISEMLLRERLAALQQAAMVERNYETGQYTPTPAGRAVQQFLQTMIKLMAGKIEQELPEIFKTR